MKTVCFIDDDIFVTRLYQNLLQNEGIHITPIQDGQEAIDKLPEILPGVIVLDLHMPNPNGVEVLRFIRNHEKLKDIPVIIFSNGYVQDLVNEVGNIGVEKLFTKLQCKPHMLVNEIKELIEKTPEPAAKESKVDLNVAAEHLPEVPLNKVLKQLHNEERPQVLRLCLIHINQHIKKTTHSGVLTTDESKPQSQLNTALVQLITDLYDHPELINPSAIETLTEGVKKLEKLCAETEGKLNSEATLKDILKNIKTED